MRRYSQSFYLRWMLMMMLAAILWQFWMADFWRVQEVVYQGQYQHTRVFIEEHLKKEQVLGQHLVMLSPMKIKESLLKNPLLQDIRVERRLFPAALIIKVREREPAFEIELKPSKVGEKSELVLVDLEGHRLNYSQPVIFKQALRFRITPALLKTSLSEKHLLILHQLKSQSQTLTFPEGVFDISQPENIVLYTSVSPAPVWLGQTLDMSRKLELLPSVIDVAKKKRASISYLDLRFWRHPVIRVKSLS